MHQQRKESRRKTRAVEVLISFTQHIHILPHIERCDYAHCVCQCSPRNGIHAEMYIQISARTKQKKKKPQTIYTYYRRTDLFGEKNCLATLNISQENRGKPKVHRHTALRRAVQRVICIRDDEMCGGQ